MPNLAGLHDREAATIAPPDTWIVDTIALSENPQPPSYRGDLHWIVRANWGYGTTGTIPTPNLVNTYIERLTRYVKASHGVRRWIIGNEPNLVREWPNGMPIMPSYYAEVYRKARAAIKALPGRANDEVLIAGPGPWNAELTYPGNSAGDWVRYFADVIAHCQDEIDGFAIHSYTHGYNVALVTSSARMDPPFQHRHYEFRAYRDFLEAIPESLEHLPVYMTEANGDGPWQAVGLIPAMLGEVDAWNKTARIQIQCVIFYRYPKFDGFAMDGRPDVINEYMEAVKRGYQSPQPAATQQQRQQTFIPTVSTGVDSPMPDLPRDIDPRLIQRGVTIETPQLAPGETYWRVVKARWFSEQEAGGRHHIYVETITPDGRPVAGVPFAVWWPSGSKVEHTKAGGGFEAGNFPMSPSLNEFLVHISDGVPSETVRGIGMGANGNPGIHTSTLITFQLATVPQVQPTPDPVQPPGGLPVTPPPTQEPQPDNWERCIAFVRRWEGGFVNNPHDPGGATNKGITIGTLTRWRTSRGLPAPTVDDLRNLTDAEANQIYYEWYWKASGSDKLAWPVCLAHFDTAVNAGVGRAQEMLAKSNGDFLRYMGHLIDWYTKIPNFEHFGRAWIRRRAEILLEAANANQMKRSNPG